MKAIIIMGSTSDEPHAKKITNKLDEYGIEWEQHAASAHKNPLAVLEILEANKEHENIVYITIAGRSNALNSQLLAALHFQIRLICLLIFIRLSRCLATLPF